MTCVNDEERELTYLSIGYYCLTRLVLVRWFTLSSTGFLHLLPFGLQHESKDFPLY
jgi:hypothetical protein